LIVCPTGILANVPPDELPLLRPFVAPPLKASKFALIFILCAATTANAADLNFPGGVCFVVTFIFDFLLWVFLFNPCVLNNIDAIIEPVEEWLLSLCFLLEK
jgi:hypothetical protein